jgi:beta-glucosidase
MTSGYNGALPNVEARSVELLYENGLPFKDLNKNGRIDAYEDWRQPAEDRAADLLSQMTLDEKAGMLMIDQLNADKGGQAPKLAGQLILQEQMRRFIFRNTVTKTPAGDAGNPFFGAQITPYETAQFTNAVQELCESTRLGIPALFKSNPRNHYEEGWYGGLDASSGAFSAWPKEAGLAATRDLELIGEFAQTVAKEWVALGIRGMYGYCLDLSTEPRWFRITETFTQDADFASEIATILVKNIQGETLNHRSVAVTMKHFPGGGPQQGGADAHFEFGKHQTYPSDNFDYHVKPFIAAIEAGVSSIMPYYGIPVGQKYLPNDVGMSFSKGIVTDLLREELGFKGNVNSDTGIATMMPWGVEHLSVGERVAMAINAGVDVLSGFSENQQIMTILDEGMISSTRVDESVKRLLVEQFQLGLFENPYVDPNRADYVLGSRITQTKADAAQRKSIVLLQNRAGLLPLEMPTPKEQPDLYTRLGFGPKRDASDDKQADREVVRKQIYVMGVDPEVAGGEEWNEFDIVSGDYDADAGETRPAVPDDTDYAIIRVVVGNNSKIGGGFLPVPDPDELDLITFADMEKSNSWTLSPSLDDIHGVMSEISAARTILAIRFRQPFVLDAASGLRDAGAILATFGAHDAALMDLLTGKHEPTAKLTFALAESAEAILRQDSDAPGYIEEDILYPFGHGLGY